jgi:hypothetical protein
VFLCLVNVVLQIATLDQLAAALCAVVRFTHVNSRECDFLKKHYKPDKAMLRRGWRWNMQMCALPTHKPGRIYLGTFRHAHHATIT